MKRDLSQRLTRFGVEVLIFLPTLPHNIEIRNVRTQLSRSATSIGANYMESQIASSKADFINKLHISSKELWESIFWLETIHAVCRDDLIINEKATELLREADELKRILVACIITAKKNLIDDLKLSNK